jgi:multisubunit Na+/H+ antiporter MnhB subunit
VKDLDVPTFTALFGIMTVVVVVAGYSIGRAHAAWQSVGIVKRRVKSARVDAWARIRNAAVLVVVVVLLVVAVIRDALS